MPKITILIVTGNQKKYKENSQDVEEDKTIEFSRTAPSPEELMIANQNLEKILDHIKLMKKRVSKSSSNALF